MAFMVLATIFCLAAVFAQFQPDTPAYKSAKNIHKKTDPLRVHQAGSQADYCIKNRSVCDKEIFFGGAFTYSSRQGATPSKQHVTLQGDAIKVFGKSSAVIDHISFAVVDFMGLSQDGKLLEMDTLTRRISIGRVDGRSINAYFEKTNSIWRRWHRYQPGILNNNQKRRLIKNEETRRARVLQEHQRKNAPPEPSISNRMDGLFGASQATNKAPQNTRGNQAKPIKGCDSTGNCVTGPDMSGGVGAILDRINRR